MTTLLRASARDLDLPPPFRLATLREVGDAHRHAGAVAGRDGAGTLVWVRRFDLAEFAVVLEPEEELATARRAFFVGMDALARAIAAIAPPEMPLALDWPDGIRIDGVLVGGGRLAWPQAAAEDEVPDWLVFSAMIRLTVMRGGAPGLRPLLGGLDELGFEAPDAGTIIEGFARHLMAGFHDWRETGFETVTARYLSRLPDDDKAGARLTGTGDLAAPGVPTRRLRDALAAPSWLDPETGAPWL